MYSERTILTFEKEQHYDSNSRTLGLCGMMGGHRSCEYFAYAIYFVSSKMFSLVIILC